MTEPLPVKTLLVDLDGTLLAAKNFRLSVDFVLRAVGKLRKSMGNSTRAALSLLSAINSELKSAADQWVPEKLVANRAIQVFSDRLKVPFEEGQKLMRAMIDEIFPTLEKYFYPAPGAQEFLDWAKDHYTLVLATNPVWATRTIELRLKWAGVDPAIFKSLTHSYRMHSTKPSPQYFQEILEQEGLKAEDCMLVGNETKMDLPATRVGIRAFIVNENKELKEFPKREGRAQAWSGDFAALRRLLEGKDELSTS